MKSNKKIIYFIISSFLLMPISFIISCYLDSILNFNFSIIFDFNEILNNILDFRIIKLAFCVQALIMVLIFLLIFLGKNSMYKVDTQVITKNIIIPKSSGKGQHGTSRFATKKEFDETYNTIKFNKNKDYYLQKIESGGVVVNYDSKKKYEKISYIADNKHLICIGSTGCGKTRRIVIESLCMLGLASESIIVSDPKGELYQLTFNFFKKLGYEISVIDFRNTKKSNKYNFLQNIIDEVDKGNMRKAEEYTWDFVESIVPRPNGNTDPLWGNGEKSIIAGSILTVIYENRENKKYQNLTNVYYFISNMCKTDENGYMPLVDYVDNLNDENPAKKMFAISTIAPERTRGSFFTSALSTLRLFSSEDMYTMTNNSDFKLNSLGIKKEIRFIILPDEDIKYYEIASIFISLQYQALVRLADLKGGKLNVRNNFILDEFGNFTKIANFENMLTVSRSRNIRINMFLQSFAQLEIKYSKNVAQIIMDNAQIWIYLKASSVETTNIISKRLGNYTVAINSHSSSRNRTSDNISESLSIIGRNLLTPDEISRFEIPHSLVIQSGVFPASTNIPDLSKWKFNKVLGLGNEKENTLIREKVENERAVMGEEKLEIWKIWEDYRY